jgi:hypothetical protein
MNTNTHVSPKDFFLHLGATIALYASAVALINLAFEVANRALPDALTQYYSSGSIVWPISMLIVLVPLLYILERLISHDILKVPEKRDIWVRRWRVYMTLFLTGVTIAVDVIVLINTYLNGEISTRFILKVFIVLVISAVIFAYYLLAKNALDPNTDSRRKWLVLLSSAGVVLTLAGIVSGFVIVGSPATQRALRFDSQRVNDLSSIQWQIVDYWQKTRHLPPDLKALSDGLNGFSVPTDPQTGQSYEYISLNKDPNSFALCATFYEATALAKDSSGVAAAPMRYASDSNKSETWAHAAGHQCFERTIDPKLYPPLNKPI